MDNPHPASMLVSEDLDKGHLGSTRAGLAWIPSCGFGSLCAWWNGPVRLEDRPWAVPQGSVLSVLGPTYLCLFGVFRRIRTPSQGGKESTCNVGDLASIPGLEDPLEKVSGRVYAPRFFVSSQQRFGVTDIKAPSAGHSSQVLDRPCYSSQVSKGPCYRS